MAKYEHEDCSWIRVMNTNYEKRIESKGFWRWCITLRIIGYVDFARRSEFQTMAKFQKQSNSKDQDKLVTDITEEARWTILYR
jgi:hypothetical protein